MGFRLRLSSCPSRKGFPMTVTCKREPWGETDLDPDPRPYCPLATQPCSLSCSGTG